MPMPDDFNPNMPEPAEEPDEPDYDAELELESLLASAANWAPTPGCFCDGGEFICSPDCCHP